MNKFLEHFDVKYCVDLRRDSEVEKLIDLCRKKLSEYRPNFWIDIRSHIKKR